MLCLNTFLLGIGPKIRTHITDWLTFVIKGGTSMSLDNTKNVYPGIVLF
jgi:hypothetical protein